MNHYLGEITPLRENIIPFKKKVFHILYQNKFQRLEYNKIYKHTKKYMDFVCVRV